MHHKDATLHNDSTQDPNSADGMARRVRQALGRLHGEEVAAASTLKNLGGHASLRIYWRVTLPDAAHAHTFARGESTLMAMVLPMSADAFRSEEGMSQTAAPSDELTFINMQRFLARIDMPVPQIDRVDMDLGVLLLEDLGDQTFEAATIDVRNTTTGEDAKAHAFLDLYREAIDLLVAFQAGVTQARNDENRGEIVADCVGFGREFDRELLRWELDHYLEWGLEARLADNPARLARVHAHRDALTREFDRIVDELLQVPQTLVLRDYQSRNLMRKHGAWHLIDFQDALLGPFVYDLVALLRDSYIALSDAQVTQLLHHYIARAQAAALPFATDADAMTRAFYLQTVQRKLKDAGRFINIDRVKANPSFLPYYEPSIGYVFSALTNLPDYQSLSEILHDLEGE